jgi:hypothetical protein
MSSPLKMRLLLRDDATTSLPYILTFSWLFSIFVFVIIK